MTDDEARSIATIMLTADGGCAWCAEALMQQMIEKFPESEPIIQAVYHEEYPDAPKLVRNKCYQHQPMGKF